MSGRKVDKVVSFSVECDETGELKLYRTVFEEFESRVLGCGGVQKW